MNRTSALLLAVVGAPAASAADTFSYDYVDAFYQQLEVDNEFRVVEPGSVTVYGINGDGEAYGLRGAWSLGDNWFLGGEWRRRDYEQEASPVAGFEWQQDVAALDAGGHWSLGDSTDFVARAGVVRAEDSGQFEGGIGRTETSYRVLFGLRHALTDGAEVYLHAGKTGLDETNGFQGTPVESGDGLLAEAGFRYAVSDRWSLLLEGSRNGEFTEYGLGASYAL